MKCKDCEHMVVEKVNKTFSRGHGRCSICHDIDDCREEEKYRIWIWANRYVCFSDPACKYYISRISGFSINDGNNLLPTCIKLERR